MTTAFQRNAFQNNAFQIDAVATGEIVYSPGGGGGMGTYTHIPAEDVSALKKRYRKAVKKAGASLPLIVDAVTPYVTSGASQTRITPLVAEIDFSALFLDEIAKLNLELAIVNIEMRNREIVRVQQERAREEEEQLFYLLLREL